ncbi:c-type cytochrome [Dyadobacter jejuensis]|nr:c-type cytochrome [Dyadobacter jejuensis]
MKKISVFIIALLLGFQQAHAQQKASTNIPDDIQKLLQQYACLACHKADARLVGPAYTDVAKKKYTNPQIVELIYNPKPANWPGYPPMAPMKNVPEKDALKIAAWINSLAKKHS